MGPSGQVSPFPPRPALSCSFLVLHCSSTLQGRSRGKRDPPEEGTFRLRRDFQAIKKTGGHALHAEGFDLELYCMVSGHLDVPHAVGVGWVRIWVVGAAEEAPWTRKEAPTGCRNGGQSSEFIRRDPFFPKAVLSGFPSKLPSWASLESCPYYSLAWRAGLMSASCCPVVAGEVVLVLVVGVVPVVVRPRAGSGLLEAPGGGAACSSRGGG